MINLQNKIALITAADLEAGRDASFKLASFGVNLILTAKTSDKIKELKKEILSKYDIKINAFPLDVNNQDEVTKKISHCLIKQNIDIFINNDENILYFKNIILPHMINNQQGHIVDLKANNLNIEEIINILKQKDNYATNCI